MPKFRSAKARALYAELTQGHVLTKQEPRDGLAELVMHVSEGCNLGCTYCFADKGQYGAAKAKWMKAEDARRYVHSMVDQYKRIDSVKFFGGEPLINAPAVRAVCETFRELSDQGRVDHEPEYFAISNMTITNKAVIGLINKYGIKITGSIDGPKDINDKFRVYANGRGSWEAIDRGIRKLQAETGQPVSLEVVYGPSHLEMGYSMLDIHQYLENRYGIDAIVIHPMSAEDGVVQQYDWKSYYDCLRPIAYEYATWLVNEFETPSKAKTIKFLINKIITPVRADTHCSLGVSTQTVTADGILYPCYTLIGHDDFVMSEDVTQPIFRDKYNRVQLRLINNTKSANPVCSKCDVMVTCLACPGSNLSTNGAIEVPNPGHCEHSIGETEGLLDALIELRQQADRWDLFNRILRDTELFGVESYDAGMSRVLQD